MCVAIVRESDGIDLGDERLNKRSQLLIASLARDVQASVNAACETLDQVLRVIDDYASRWVIETFFRTLKTGRQVEQILLETLPRVENAAWFKVR